MSMRYQAGVLTASYFPLKVPDAPTIGTASQASSTSVSVTFTAPSNVGGGAITGYVAVATDSSSGATFTGTGSSSPITISGLTTGNTYTVKVAATNAYGTGPLSAASNSIQLITPYSQSYTTAGSYSWIAPAGYTAMNVIVIGGGGSGGMGGGGTAGGGGGGYAKSVNVPVTPGNSYTVVVGSGGGENPNGSIWYVGTSGGTSQFNSTITATGGTGAGNNGSRVSGGVGSGGNSLNLTGGYGGASTEAGGNGPTGGGGGFGSGASFFNGGTANQTYGGNGGNAVSTSAGQNGSNYGGGGGGGNGRYNTNPSSNCLGAVGGVFIYYP